MNFPTIPSRVVLAPMAGGPGTPELAAAVSNADGLGFLPSGYVSADRLRQHLSVLQSLTERPFGVNLLVPPGPDPARLAAAEAYAERINAWAQPLGLPTARPAYTDDDFADKVEILIQAGPPVVSFTFGVPDALVLDALRRNGVAVWITVTTPEEASIAEAAGADALIVQGAEAGAHQGGWLPPDGDPLGLLPLLQLVGRATSVPVVAAGGLATGAGIAAVLAAGAEAAMLGTAFLCCSEAGTAPGHVDALGGPERTTLTRAFTGRPARSIRNDFVDTFGAQAPFAYPEVHVLSAPLRAAARQRHEREAMHLWAGQTHALVRGGSAADVLDELARAARASVERLGQLGLGPVEDQPPRGRASR